MAQLLGSVRNRNNALTASGTMLREIENVSARLGVYSILLGLIIGFAVLIPNISSSPLWVIILFSIGAVFIILSFGVFRFQMLSSESRENLLWGVLLCPIILYIPLNLILMYAGLVQQPKLQDFGAYYNGAVRFLDGAPLYQTTQEIPSLQAQISGDMPYLYPPVFILLFVPFTIFSCHDCRSTLGYSSTCISYLVGFKTNIHI